MTQDEIIELAREALKQEPREDWNSTAWVFADETLQTFAKLVAEKEREACAKLIAKLTEMLEIQQKLHETAIDMLKPAIEAEREACWNIIFEYAGRDDITLEDESLLKHLADLIRARGKA